MNGPRIRLGPRLPGRQAGWLARTWLAAVASLQPSRLGLVLGGVFVAFSLFLIYDALGHYRSDRSHFAGDSFIQEDREIGYIQRSHITMRHPHPPAYTIYTDQIGTRVNGPNLKSPPRADVLVIGCSVAWGYGIENESTFSQRIARATGLVVSNAAVPSYGMTAALLSLKRHAPLKPKVVIYGFNDQHIPRAMKPCAPTLGPYCRSVAFVDFDNRGRAFIHKPEFTSPEFFRYTQEVALDHPFGFLDLYWAARRIGLLLLRKDSVRLNARYPATDSPPLREKAVRFLLRGMVEEVRDLKARLLIVYIPWGQRPQPPPAEFTKVVREFAGHPDIVWLDLTGTFQNYVRQKGPTSLMVGGVISHANEEGHRLVAEAVVPLLREMSADARG